MSKDLGFTPEAQPAACWFIGGFIGLLGVGLLITGLDKLEHDPGWMIPQILFASTLVFLGWRIAQYHKRTVLALRKDAISRLLSNSTKASGDPDQFVIVIDEINREAKDESDDE